MNDSILMKIKALPPLDDTIIKIQTICMDKNSSLGDLSKVIEQDPMLTANILKAANSPLYGFSREVKNVNHAISLFGMSTIRGFALSSTIRQNIKMNFSPYNIDNAKFIQISTLQSALMLRWYSKVNRELLDILIPASFLMEIGKIILANELIDRNEDELFRQNVKSIQKPLPLSNLEHDMLGFTNEEITARIFEQWNLEVELVEAIRYSNNPSIASSHIQKFAYALHVIKNAINVFEQLSPQSIENSASIVEKSGLDKQVFEDAISKVII